MSLGASPEALDAAMTTVARLVLERNEWRLRAEAAEATLERVRAIHRNAGPSQGYDSRFKGGYGMLGDCCAACGSHGEYGVEWPCPTIAALDGAPEPEWEWGVQYIPPSAYIGEPVKCSSEREARLSVSGSNEPIRLHRRRPKVVHPAGPWLPVEGEKP